MGQRRYPVADLSAVECAAVEYAMEFWRIILVELERPDILTRASDLQEISLARASTRRDALAGRNSEHT
jgi:hypothetical protein